MMIGLEKMELTLPQVVHTQEFIRSMLGELAFQKTDTINRMMQNDEAALDVRCVLEKIMNALEKAHLDFLTQIDMERSRNQPD